MYLHGQEILITKPLPECVTAAVYESWHCVKKPAQTQTRWTGAMEPATCLTVTICLQIIHKGGVCALHCVRPGRAEGSEAWMWVVCVVWSAEPEIMEFNGKC